MKLWMKQAVLVLMVVLVLVGACLAFSVSTQAENMMQEALKSCQNNLNTIVEHMSAVGSQNQQLYSDEVTKRSVIDYYFTRYASILQNSQSKYAIWLGTDDIFQATVNRYFDLLPASDQFIAEYRLFMIDGKYFFLAYQNMTFVELPITIYHALTVDDTIGNIRTLTLVTQITLAFCIALLALILPLIIRNSLRPLNKLTKMAEAMSGGAYALRTGYADEDEVGTLSITFDKMADTIQESIASLEETVNRRELLLAALTHELKTPMTAIIGYADGYLTLPLNDEQKSDSIKGVYDAAKRVERLSQKMMQLISYSETKGIEKRPVSVAHLLENIKEETSALLHERNISLNTSTIVDMMFADYDLLFSLLANLVDNAAKASPNNSAIYLSALKVNGQVRFTVEDHGCGIPEDQIPLIFDPFYRVDKARDRRKGGVGLGLSLCEMIVSAHNGSIKVDSAVGKGTVIQIDMPQGGRYEP